MHPLRALVNVVKMCSWVQTNSEHSVRNEKNLLNIPSFHSLKKKHSAMVSSFSMFCKKIDTLKMNNYDEVLLPQICINFMFMKVKRNFLTFSIIILLINVSLPDFIESHLHNIIHNYTIW